MVKPYLSAPLMDSWSRTEPPDWMMALIPALAISSTLSAKTRTTKDIKAPLYNLETYYLYLL